MHLLLKERDHGLRSRLLLLLLRACLLLMEGCCDEGLMVMAPRGRGEELRDLEALGLRDLEALGLRCCHEKLPLSLEKLLLPLLLLPELLLQPGLCRCSHHQEPIHITWTQVSQLQQPSPSPSTQPQPQPLLWYEERLGERLTNTRCHQSSSSSSSISTSTSVLLLLHLLDSSKGDRVSLLVLLIECEGCKGRDMFRPLSR